MPAGCWSHQGQGMPAACRPACISSEPATYAMGCGWIHLRLTIISPGCIGCLPASNAVKDCILLSPSFLFSLYSTVLSGATSKLAPHQDTWRPVLFLHMVLSSTLSLADGNEIASFTIAMPHSRPESCVRPQRLRGFLGFPGL